MLQWITRLTGQIIPHHGGFNKSPVITDVYSRYKLRPAHRQGQSIGRPRTARPGRSVARATGLWLYLAAPRPPPPLELAPPRRRIPLI